MTMQAEITRRLSLAKVWRRESVLWRDALARYAGKTRKQIPASEWDRLKKASARYSSALDGSTFSTMRYMTNPGGGREPRITTEFVDAEIAHIERRIHECDTLDTFDWDEIDAAADRYFALLEQVPVSMRGAYTAHRDNLRYLARF